MNDDIDHLVPLFFKILEFLETLKGDDPRNTDNAWLETTVLNFMDDDGIFRLVFSSNQNVCHHQPIRKREN